MRAYGPSSTTTSNWNIEPLKWGCHYDEHCCATSRWAGGWTVKPLETDYMYPSCCTDCTSYLTLYTLSLFQWYTSSRMQVYTKIHRLWARGMMPQPGLHHETTAPSRGSVYSHPLKSCYHWYHVHHNNFRPLRAFSNVTAWVSSRYQLLACPICPRLTSLTLPMASNSLWAHLLAYFFLLHKSCCRSKNCISCCHTSRIELLPASTAKH